MTSLARTQSDFTKSLLDRTMPVPADIRGASRRRADRRFAVNRNNVASGLAHALATRFPVVNRLVGEEFFRAMALVYAAAELPRSPIMLYYGETFPAFIDDFEPVVRSPISATSPGSKWRAGALTTPPMRRPSNPTPSQRCRPTGSPTLASGCIPRCRSSRHPIRSTRSGT